MLGEQLQCHSSGAGGVWEQLKTHQCTPRVARLCLGYPYPWRRMWGTQGYTHLPFCCPCRRPAQWFKGEAPSKPQCCLPMPPQGNSRGFSPLPCPAHCSAAGKDQTPKQGMEPSPSQRCPKLLFTSRSPVHCSQQPAAAHGSPHAWETLLLLSRAPEGGTEPTCIRQTSRAEVQQQENVFGKHLFSQTAATWKTKSHPCHQLLEGESRHGRDLLPLPSSHGEGVDVVDLVREVLLALLSQEVQPSSADNLVDHVQVPADAAVHIVHDHTLLSHVVLDDHNAVGPQAGTAALQEVGEVVVGEMSWRSRAGVRGQGVTKGKPEAAFGIPPDPSGQMLGTFAGKALAWECPTCVSLLDSIQPSPVLWPLRAWGK